MKIGIVIPTYYRKDGASYRYLERALKSIKNQEHTNYFVYLMGDNYEKEEELEDIAKILPPNKIQVINLDIAVEREKYEEGSRELWCCGGVNATNTGNRICLSDGIDYVCHLDHDDWWEVDHLSKINQVIEEYNPSFIFTCSSHLGSYLPKFKLDDSIIKVNPRPYDMVRSSSCLNLKKLNIPYRDTLIETGISTPSDADLWERLNKTINEQNLESYNISSITCNHTEEGH